VPRLSVIIVNYNVRHFLEQALVAALKAAERVDTEIIVVDNRSVDGSADLVARRFPGVRLVRNERNTGFAVANNQGMALARGDYWLLLNPDTVVAEDTFERTVAYLDAHPDVGGLGVRMLDGKGEFLPESKRAFPSPGVAFWKAFGFSALFPRSRVFGRYHLGYLPEGETHDVEVLSGAFMMLRASVIREIGGLDETFFMYGEDIDLSYRIVRAGYRNVYYAGTTIIHYKGESTKKGSLNYVRMFYAAMKIFARKHFRGRHRRVFIALINAAITFRAGLALARRAFARSAAPLLDAALLFGGMVALKTFWERNIKALDGVTYPPEYLYINVPLYIATWLGAVWLSGGYDRPARTFRVVRGVLIGTLLIAAIYGFLEEGLRFSRGMIVSGAAWAVVAMSGWRLLAHALRTGNFRLGEEPGKRLVIVGREAEARRVQGLLDRYEVDVDLAGFVRPDDEPFDDERLLGSLEELPDIVTVFGVDELIFCGRDLRAADIIAWMTRLGTGLDYKIVPRDAVSIIGSNSRNSAGDLYSIDIHLAIADARHRRAKALFDAGLALVLLLLSPLLAWFLDRPAGLPRNALAVLAGRRTWVGYAPEGPPPAEARRVEAVLAAAAAGALTGEDDAPPAVPGPDTALPGPGPAAGAPGHGAADAGPADPGRLPRLRPGVLHPADALGHGRLSSKVRARLNLLYARDYAVERDAAIVWRAWRSLGR
jgi:GT2 family glycosyltransferase